MPELPEVETIARSLREPASGPGLVGMQIERAQVNWSRTVAEPDAATFQKRISGQVIRDVGRRGKFLLFNLESGALILHLRMSGDLRLEPVEMPEAAHDRLLLIMKAGWRLAFNDTRKFGRVWLVDQPDTILGTLGPEPLDPGFMAETLYQRLQKTQRQLKPLLLDQHFLAGIGNIYADEALHRAGLHPLSRSNSVSAEQAARLWGAIRDTLEEGIRRNGASIDWVYRGGEFQNYFRVYQRKGLACPVCGTAVEKILVGQRGTHFCPVCQPNLER